MEQRTVLGQIQNSNKRKSLLPGFKPGAGKLANTAKSKSSASRMSLGPGLASTSYGRTSLGGGIKSARNSIAPGDANKHRRKSSVGSALSGKQRGSMVSNAVKLNDPRPISNKGFMQAGIRNLIEFLTQRNYDYPISPKVLARPTGKDFQNILQFLFLLVDRNLRFSQKFTDEVPAIFKGLKYPFNISKTALSAVGSMHTWPPLLASLIWLMELLECHEIAMEREIHEEEENSDKLFFVYLRKAYLSFLCGDDDKYEELDRELIMNFEERDRLIQSQTEEEKERGQELLRELDNLKNDESSLEALRTRKKDFGCDREKFKQLIAKLKEHKENLEAKNREREAEVNARQHEFNEAVRMRDNYQRKLDEQEISAEDAERMNKEKEWLNEEQERIAQEREKMEQEILDLEMQIEKRQETLKKAVESYNNIAATLKLVPKTAQNSQGVDFELRLNLRSATNLLSADVKKQLRPALMQLKDFALRRTQEAKTECLELQDQVDQNEDQKGKLERELSHAETKFKELEAESLAKKEALDKQLAELVDETKGIQDTVTSIQNGENSSSLVEQELHLLKEAEATLLKEEQQFDKQEAEMETQMHAFLDMILEHKQQIEDILSTVVSKHRQHLDNLQEVSEAKIGELVQLAEQANDQQ